ncbi:MAG: pyridoxamine 5'-phosphate oxidase family protein [Ilumatobacteraceae bacterium]
MDSIDIVAPAFVDMAHRIVWATAATVDTAGNPATRILHPVWEWDGSTLTGWIATSPHSLKAKHLTALPRLSLTYWHPCHDTCTARCRTAWELSDDQRVTGWRRFAEAPSPVGYDPAIVPGWESPSSPNFGILRVEPTALRVMDGSRMVGGAGRLLTWTDHA